MGMAPCYYFLHQITFLWAWEVCTELQVPAVNKHLISEVAGQRAMFASKPPRTEAAPRAVSFGQRTPFSRAAPRICLHCGRPRFNTLVGKIPWRRKWHPTPVPLPGKSHGRRSWIGYSPWGHKESDMTEWLHFSISPSNEYSWLISFRIDWFDLLTVYCYQWERLFSWPTSSSH